VYFCEGLRWDLLNEPVNVSFVRSGQLRVILTVLPIPDTNGLWFVLAIVLSPTKQHALTVVGATQYPWELVVEEDGPDIVQVAVQCEKTSPSLV
jgi:hypothetical protein